ncbi:MAG: glycine cleavage system protein GcvH [Candidatus Omnitrophota bacterium]
MTIPEDLKYTKEHEWVRIEGDEAVIGITDHAQSELGDITFVELPKIGSSVKQSGSIATVESVKAASDIYAPLSGKVIEANFALEDKPESINRSAYGDGWICRIKAADLSEAGRLMDSKAYAEYLEGAGQ